MDNTSPGCWWYFVLLNHIPPEEGWTCSTLKQGQHIIQQLNTLTLTRWCNLQSNLADALAATLHSGAAWPWCLVDCIFSCHDSPAPKPLFAWCQKSSNWGMFYSSTTEGNLYVFISSSLVIEPSPRSEVGHNLIDCVALTHFDTQRQPSYPWSQTQARWSRKYFELTIWLQGTAITPISQSSH